MELVTSIINFLINNFYLIILFVIALSIIGAVFRFLKMALSIGIVVILIGLVIKFLF